MNCFLCQLTLSLHSFTSLLWYSASATITGHTGWLWATLSLLGQDPQALEGTSRSVLEQTPILFTSYFERGVWMDLLGFWSIYMGH